MRIFRTTRIEPFRRGFSRFLYFYHSLSTHTSPVRVINANRFFFLHFCGGLLSLSVAAVSRATRLLLLLLYSSDTATTAGPQGVILLWHLSGRVGPAGLWPGDIWLFPRVSIPRRPCAARPHATAVRRVRYRCALQAVPPSI